MVVRSAGKAIRLVAIALTNPIDDTSSELRMTYMIKNWYGLPLLDSLLRLTFGLLTDPEVDAENAIWDRKTYVARPLFLPHEKGIRALRRWYEQFYETTTEARPAQ